MGKLKDRFAKLVRGPTTSKVKTVPEPQPNYSATRTFTDSAEADAIPISKPNR